MSLKSLGEGTAIFHRHIFRLLLLAFICSLPAFGDQVVERQGREILAFDIPDLEPLGYKDGKLTRTSFGRVVGEGKLKVTVQIKAWVNVDKLDGEYREDKQAQRINQHSRLKDDPIIPGADKALSYSSDDPYPSLVIICYTKDYRCELIVTGTKQAQPLMESTYQQLLDTLSIETHSAISPIRITPSSEAED